MSEIRWTQLQADNTRMALDVMSTHVMDDALVAVTKAVEYQQQPHGSERLIGGLMNLANILIKDKATTTGIDRETVVGLISKMVDDIPIRDP